MKKIKYLLFLFAFSTLFLFTGVVKAEEPFYNITGLYLKSTEVDAGGKLYVDLYMIETDESTQITGYFYNGSMDNPKLIGLDLKDIDTRNPYFELSSYMLPGETYHLDTIYVKDSKDAISYVTSPNGTPNYMNLQGKDTFKVKSTPEIRRFATANTTPIKPDGLAKFWLDTDIEFDYLSIGIRNTSSGYSDSIGYLSKQSDGSYALDLTKVNSGNIMDGNYMVTDMFFFLKNSTSTLHYSKNSVGADVQPLKFDVFFQVKSEEQTVVAPVESDFLKSIELKSTTAKANDRVFVKLNSTKGIISAKLIFSNDTDSMTVNLKNLTTEPNFIVPYTTKAGTYNLDYAILKDVDGKEYQYRKGEDYYNIKHFDFNSTLTVEEEKVVGDILNIDNSKITTDTVEKIKELESNVVIEIDASANPIITKELFESIKETNKTFVIKYNNVEWTFNGLDVKNAKQIDVSTSIYNVTEEDALSGKVKSGLVLDFADNDKLPGKCLIKLYNNEQIAQILNKNNANVYYFNEKTKKFDEIKLNAEYNTEGYYEFYVDHNSKYVITTEKLDDSLISEKTTDSNKSSKGISLNTILLIAIPSAIVIILLIVFILAKKNKKNNKKEVAKEEVKTKEDKKEE